MLRPHQVEGVQFLFDCLMGIRSSSFKGNGCILADDMGLGKTLQAITLIWTLLNQSPNGEVGAQKCLIVCPSSLVGVRFSRYYAYPPRIGVKSLKSG